MFMSRRKDGRKVKSFFVLGLMIAALAMTGCAAQKAPPQEATPAEPVSITDYMDIEAGTVYTFEGLGNEYASFTITNDFADGWRLQQRLDNGGTVLARVLEAKDGALVRTFTREESYDPVNYLGEPSNDNEILLKEPLAVGTSWTSKNGRTRTITSVDETLETPSGTYQTLVVETKGAEDVVLDYYAKGIGLVKTVFQSGDTEVSSTLSKID